MGVDKLMFKGDVEFNPDHFENPAVLRILWAALRTAPPMYGGTVVVTSANDGRHRTDSLHYECAAFDIRILGARPGGLDVGAGHTMAPGELANAQWLHAGEWAARMRRKLGDDYDVVVERDHIHVEFDPK